MSAADDTVSRAIETVVVAAGLAVYDVELSGAGRARVLRVTVTDDAGRGPDIDRLAALTRDLDRVVDEVVSGPFSLEVSSPGLERALRTPQHYATAIDERVSIKHRREGVATRTIGLLVAADETRVEVLDDTGERIAIDVIDITAARTVFDWGPSPRPGKGSKPPSAHGAKSSAAKSGPERRAKEPTA
jgi:ribosome maturation factor RimP